MIIIGIGGGSSSGKTTIVKLLKQHFSNKIAVIDLDNYYFSREDLKFEQRKNINYDIPDSIEFYRVVENIKELKKGKTIKQPVFSFKTFLRENELTATEPMPILIVDGIFSLYFEELRKLYDIKVYVDVDSEIRFARRIIRDTTIHGRPIEFVIEQYFNKVKPMHDIYVEPCKKCADIIIPFYENSEKGVEFLIKMIEREIQYS